LTIVSVLALGGCQLIAADRARYDTGEARVTIVGEHPPGPTNPMKLINGGWVEGSGNDAQEGGGATYTSSDGWTLVLNGVSENGTDGSITIGNGEPMEWDWHAGGSTTDGCRFTLDDGIPRAFGGTVHCPALAVIGADGETVDLSVTFTAS
jgi:hypothetical protein